MRKCVPPEVRLLVFLRYIATGAPPSILSDVFKLGITTVRVIISEISQAIVEALPSPTFPTDLASVVRRFDKLRKSAFPGVVGAIDGSHIRIETPCANPSDYFCYKKFKSIVLLAISGPDCECLWFHVGYPGKACDGRIFRETGVNNFVEGLDIDQHLIGDNAFPASVGLMKPYPYNEGLSEEAEYFNFKLSSSRMVIECFFGQLKSRFRCLLHGLQFRSVTSSCYVVSACVVLHNFILASSPSDEPIFFDDDLLETNDLDNLDDPDPGAESQPSFSGSGGSDEAAGELKRDYLCQTLWRDSLVDR